MPTSGWTQRRKSMPTFDNGGSNEGRSTSNGSLRHVQYEWSVM